MQRTIGNVPVKREVDFKVLREDWSKYEVLEGKAILWSRVILSKLYEIDNSSLPRGVSVSGGTQYLTNTQSLLTVFVHDKNLQKGPGPGILTQEELANAGADIEFQSLDEPFNEYLLPAKDPTVLRIKAVVTRVRFFQDRFNMFGDPMFAVDTEAVSSPPRKARPQDLARQA